MYEGDKQKRQNVSLMWILLHVSICMHKMHKHNFPGKRLTKLQQSPLQKDKERKTELVFGIVAEKNAFTIVLKLNLKGKEGESPMLGTGTFTES